MPDNEVAFREEQAFRQWWLWVVVLCCTCFLAWGAVQQLVLGLKWGSKPPPDGVLIVLLLLVGVGLPALFTYARLLTEVRSDALYVRYRPFHLRALRFGFDEIKTCEVRQYSGLGDFGGWGIRYGRGGVTAYTVYGDQGVQIGLENGKKVLIGSQEAERLLAAIEAGRRARGS